VNTDQGSQYTSKAWTDPLNAQGIRISMDGKVMFVERCSTLVATHTNNPGAVASALRQRAPIL
jgi:hypothetical protein